MAKSIVKSNTTRNVAIGGAGSGLLSIGTLKLLRQVVPNYIPWDPDLDEAAVALATAILTPLISRWLAFKHRPDKKG